MKTIRHRGTRKIELNQARSKPNTIFPFLQTNITSQMWPSGGKEAPIYRYK